MTDEEKKKNEQPLEGDAASQEEVKVEGKKAGMLKYLVFGVAGIAVVVAVAFGVLFMFKDDPQTVESDAIEEVAKDEKKATEDKSHKNSQSNKNSDSKDQSASKDSHDGDHQNLTDDEQNAEEFALSEEDQSAINKIMDNLAFLDYEPSSDEIELEDEKISVEDSLEQVNWLEKEKELLKKRVDELDAREKDITKREKDINAKITRLEQAESNRVSKLAKLYDGMDPRAVAQLMMNLDDETVVSILPRMKGKNASAVLQLIPSKRAARLSKQMITIAGK